MYQSNISSLHKFKLQEEVSEKNRDGEHKFPKIQRDHWGGCHGHSGQRTTEGRLGGATKNGGRGQGWIGVGGGRNRAWERARFRESERATEPARQVCLARPSSVARSPRSSRSLLARSLGCRAAATAPPPGRRRRPRSRCCRPRRLLSFCTFLLSPFLGGAR